LPEGWVLKAVRVAGSDVTDTGFDIKPGEEIRDIEIEVTTRLTEVSGAVRGPRNESVDDYTVLLFAQDRERRVGHTRHFALVRPDQSGRFRVGTLPPGDYFAVALEYVDVNEAQNPDLLEGLVKDAVSFTLRDAEAKMLDLKLAP
jgi:hypothetical protein